MTRRKGPQRHHERPWRQEKRSQRSARRAAGSSGGGGGEGTDGIFDEAKRAGQSADEGVADRASGIEDLRPAGAPERAALRGAVREEALGEVHDAADRVTDGTDHPGDPVDEALN